MNTLTASELTAVTGGFAPLSGPGDSLPVDWSLQQILDYLAQQQEAAFNRWLLGLSAD